MQKRNKVDKIKKTAGESELDVRLKEFWRQNDHFADLINAVVFYGRQRITPDMLIEQDTDISGVVSFPEYEETLRRNHDVVKKLALDTEFQVWSVENQKKAHFAMPLRTGEEAESGSGSRQIAGRDFGRVPVRDRQRRQAASAAVDSAVLW